MPCAPLDFDGNCDPKIVVSEVCVAPSVTLEHINDTDVHLLPDERAALSAANSPSAGNPIATMQDIVAGGESGVTFLQEAQPTNPATKQTWFKPSNHSWQVWDGSQFLSIHSDGGYF